MKTGIIMHTAPRKDPWDLRDGGGLYPFNPVPVGSPEALAIIEAKRAEIVGRGEKGRREFGSLPIGKTEKKGVRR